jgi:class 3 adenylate cyclase
VRVRIGLHTGEAVLGSDGYVGFAVHQAARIGDLGHGGQVLLSRSTAGLVDDEELKGIALRDLGEHRLKSLDRPERIFQLVIDGLENDFPPLDTIEGAGPAAETMTVLFTDLSGTTGRMQRLPPPAFRALVAEYHRTLGTILAEKGGLGIDAIADSATAAFRSAGKAAAAAVALLREVASREWAGGALGVGVGLDSGEVVATGHGFFGHAVNRSAALCGTAHGGQILLTEATRSLLEREDLGVAELLDLGEHQLEGGRPPVRIYQLVVPELANDFAPIVPEPRPRHQLPT